MKVTQVSIGQTQASKAAGRPVLTPELLAATGARYSRNNEGLDSILAKIDPENPDKSVDGIFRMIDYGHQSIADMAPVAMFLDGISLWTAYLVWAQCPTAGGQESSTRYLKMTAADLVAPEVLGIPLEQRGAWRDHLHQSLEAYETLIAAWSRLGESDPSITRIPKSLSEDPSEKAQKQFARMLRNFAFDRARYFLPVALKTNMMMIMSARGWVQLCQYLLSHPLPECNQLGEMIAQELNLSAPRLLRHAVSQKTTEAGLLDEQNHTKNLLSKLPVTEGIASDQAHLEVYLPSFTTEEDLTQDLQHHAHRYAYFGETIKRTSVRFGWDSVAFAEIRDLNRHRTGTKFCPPIPIGFYSAEDEAPQNSDLQALIVNLANLGNASNQEARVALGKDDSSYVYWMLLGAQLPFEHLTTADKYLYEAELRTGLGAHYRYAKHLRESLVLWYKAFPKTKGLVQEGLAEPE
jgi:thymidylate synthase ThyX